MGLHWPNPHCKHPEDLASLPRMKSVSSIGSFTSVFEDMGLSGIDVKHQDLLRSFRFVFVVFSHLKLDAVGKRCN